MLSLGRLVVAIPDISVLTGIANLLLDYFKLSRRADTASSYDLQYSNGSTSRYATSLSFPGSGRDMAAQRSPFCSELAERVGFEPTVRLHAQRFSRPPRSTALAPLRAVQAV